MEKRISIYHPLKRRVQSIVKYAYNNNIPVTYLGNGSNIIIREGGIRGIVLSLLSLDHIDVSDDAIIAGSGAAIIDVSRVARDYVLTGLEFACGIQVQLVAQYL